MTGVEYHNVSHTSCPFTLFAFSDFHAGFHCYYVEKVSFFPFFFLENYPPFPTPTPLFPRHPVEAGEQIVIVRTPATTSTLKALHNNRSDKENALFL